LRSAFRETVTHYSELGASSANLKLPQNASFDRRGGSVTLTMTTPNRFPMDSRLEKSLTVGLTAMLAGCVSVEGPSPPGYRPISATEGRALVGRLLPDGVKDRAGWATDIYAAFAALDIILS